MSRLFGGIKQIAFVVRDIDAAMNYWADTLGVGPFFVKRQIIFSDYRYRGKNSQSPLVSIALANSGDVQVELIQQHDECASIYNDFSGSGRTGLQHVSSWLTRLEFDAKREMLISKGVKVVQECAIPSSGVRLCYFETSFDDEGVVFEIADLMEPGQYERISNIAHTAKNWDGNMSVREVNK